MSMLDHLQAMANQLSQEISESSERANNYNDSQNYRFWWQKPGRTWFVLPFTTADAAADVNNPQNLMPFPVKSLYRKTGKISTRFLVPAYVLQAKDSKGEPGDISAYTGRIALIDLTKSEFAKFVTYALATVSGDDMSVGVNIYFDNPTESSTYAMVLNQLGSGTQKEQSWSVGNRDLAAPGGLSTDKLDNIRAAFGKGLNRTALFDMCASLSLDRFPFEMGDEDIFMATGGSVVSELQEIYPPELPQEEEQIILATSPYNDEY